MSQPSTIGAVSDAAPPVGARHAAAGAEPLFLGTAPATPRDRRIALVVVAVLITAGTVAAPYAAVPWYAIPTYVPAYNSSIIIIDALTALLLFGQFRELRERSLLVLACAYLFTSVAVITHALSFPEAFGKQYLYGGAQTTAWLWIAWHGLFPCFIAGYALVARRERAARAAGDVARVTPGATRRWAVTGASAAVALAGICTLLAAHADAYLPRLMEGSRYIPGVTVPILSVAWIITFVALGLLVWGTRLRRVIDLWLAVVLCAWIIDILLSALLVTGRYEIGFYVGRIYSLVAMTLVLGVLLKETLSLHGGLARALRAEREHARRAEEAQAQLQELNRYKDEFLATLSHELRNPLSAIEHSLVVMQRAGSAAPDAQRLVDIIRRQSRNLVRLVDDLLEVSRLSRGKVELRKEPVDLAAVVRNAVETVRPLLDAARHELTISLPPEPIRFLADPLRLSQIVANLLNNAAKYTQPGGHIRLEARDCGAALTIAVRDDGIGIPADMLARIFHMFVQVEQGGRRAQAGLGIGLTLVKNLVEMHGGTVTARSAGPGQGSEFSVRLPLERIGEPAPAAEGAREAGGARRVLVVDDNPDTAMTLGALLEVMGHDVQVVLDGESALAALDTRRPSLVFLDLGMPGMNGYEVAERIRQNPAYRDIALVAVTGWGQEHDRRRTRAAGFHQHLVKPVDMRTIKALLSGANAGA